MAKTRLFGWTGIAFALGIFVAGFLSGGTFHYAMMPAVTIAAPPPVVTKLPTPDYAAEFKKLADGISELRSELAEMNATLQRIAASLRKR